MEGELLKMACGQGLGYALFVFLLIYTLKTTGTRENRLNTTIEKNQEIIASLTKNTDKIDKIEKDVEDIKELIR
ncbi:UviB-like protein [Clostridium sp. P21]|uniref:UviB-like protein n=1 Tax=Clostridium muellerianum TaxID=2716538 RepID=A0A7Y0ELA8_9CLOT|nr:BhlA/UviB family holin-like peptide [Clostridium muellerianum]NMM65546.1 UviB-like protein [Clostridium muellerianum]